MRLVLLLFLMFSCTPAHADDKNRMWMTWERTAANPKLCKDRNLCAPVSTFITRLVEHPSTPKAQKMIGALDRLAVTRGEVADHPGTPKICRNSDATTILGFDPEAWELSEKLDALRGLQGICFSVAGLKNPPSYSGTFGPDVQS